MTQPEKDKIMELLTKFINDNLNNRLNEWNGETLLNRANREMTGMVNVIRPNTAREG